MFSLFKKKGSGPQLNDVVFATKEAKWKALAEKAKHDSETIFVAWFEESRDNLQAYFDQHNAKATIITHREMHGSSGKHIFIEHYPLAEKERTVFNLLQGEIFIYSSLDEALFRLFGGDRVSGLLTKLGLDENESISHSMITQSIYKAQEKLAEKVTIDHSAQSMDEWVRKNVGTSLS